MRTDHHEWHARWIAVGESIAGAMPVFRRNVRLVQPVARAVVRVCGLGHFELRINGSKVGDDVLEPGWTNYAKTCLFVTHDATAHLREGENVVEVMLGNGMYNVPGGRYRKFKGSFGPSKLILEMRVELADGRTTTIGRDGSWEWAAGPITFSCIYGGEDYDARLEQPAAWQPVVVVDGPGGALVASTAPPSRAMRSFTPIKVTEPRPGVRVYDLGQNFSGWPKLSVRGEAGMSVKLITGELLDDAGNVSQKNTGSPVSFSYTLHGGGATQTWSPRFSLTGFRYVQAEGDVKVIVDLAGQFVYSSSPPAGKFRCSNDLLNRIHELILNAIRSNLHSVITDCPHREKLGWLEQTHLMSPAIMFDFDVSRLYAKVSADMRDAQHANGCVPTIAPQYTSFKPPWDVFNDSPEWGSAVVINPWLVYRRYGDRKILEDNYDPMKRYVEYLRGREEPDGTINYGLGDWYDIGPGDPGFAKLTSHGLTATAVCYEDVKTLAKIAAVLGHAGDADRYAALAERIARAFNARFFDAETRRYDRGSQTAHAMPLALGLVSAEHRDAVLEHLIGDIRERDNHITAGDIGFRYVLTALAEAGRSDVIVDLLMRTDPPSYGCQLARGATTLTEAWDANPKNSQNHMMFGHAESWFYESLCGIQIDLSQPRGKQIVIRPAVVGDVTWAEATYESALGRIESRWKRDGRNLRIAVTIPEQAGAATVWVPASDPTRVKVTEFPANGSARHVENENRFALYEVGAGFCAWESNGSVE